MRLGLRLCIRPAVSMNGFPQNNSFVKSLIYKGSREGWMIMILLYAHENTNNTKHMPLHPNFNVWVIYSD